MKESLIEKIYSCIYWVKYYNSIDHIRELPENKYNGDKNIVPKVDKEFEEKLLLFISVIKNNFDDDVLDNFYNNLQTLFIAKDLRNIFYTEVGNYDSDENLVRLNKKGFKTAFFHELFHMASSRVDGKRTSIGFAIYERCHFNMGFAINEGYTDLLAFRYFGDKPCGTYESEVKIVTDLELIVGKEKMERLYMQANLYGLIEELEKYAPRYEIEEFIHNTDDSFKENLKTRWNVSLSYIERQRKKEEAVQEFLRKAYLRKLISEYKVGEIDNIELKKKYYEFIASHNCKVNIKNKYDNHPISKIDQDDLVKALK